MSDPLPRLVNALGAAPDQDAAGRSALEAAAELSQATVRGLRVLRGLIHHRPEGSYRALVVRDFEGQEATAILPSATAWRWLQALGAGVVVDVETRRVAALSDGSRLDRGAADFHSRAELRKRGATHVVALPMLDNAGRSVGMMALEVEHRAGIGGNLAFLAAAAPTLERIAGAVGAAFRTLPRAGKQGPSSALPVTGRAMAPVVEILRTFAALDEVLLLRGPTGAGKSNLAKWCHDVSSRAKGPLEVVHLHAIPETLQEGELFGWKKGAFTGAQRDHVGAVTRAAGGTLFLDEVDKLSLGAQGKLLRLLEERRYTPLGDDRERKAEARFLVGSNSNLEAAVQAGTFLPDLYFRVNVLPVEIPGLDQRTDEIPGWTRFFLGAMGGAELDPAAQDLLVRQSWPGNLRQLHSVSTRAYAFARAEAAVAGEGGTVVVGPRHVERALALDIRRGAGGEAGLEDLLEAAAAAWIKRSLADEAAGKGPLDFELADAFTGLVLEAAVGHFGDPKDAFVHFGHEERLKGGNHLRTVRREVDRADVLRARLKR